MTDKDPAVLGFVPGRTYKLTGVANHSDERGIYFTKIRPYVGDSRRTAARIRKLDQARGRWKAEAIRLERELKRLNQDYGRLMYKAGPELMQEREERKAAAAERDRLRAILDDILCGGAPAVAIARHSK